MKAARGGDVSAAALLLSRVWPARKGRPVAIDLPDLAQPGGAPAALAAVARLTAEGIISCEEAGEIAKVIETHMRATDMVELIRRIEKLEAQHAADAVLSKQSRAAFGTARVNGG